MYIFETSYGLYILWKELKQLQSQDQHHQQAKTANLLVQTHCLYPHPQSDVVQLNAPEYDPDIDGQPDPVADIQSPNAKNIQEDIVTNTANSE